MSDRGPGTHRAGGEAVSDGYDKVVSGPAGLSKSQHKEPGPIARCSECGRETWLPDMVGMICYTPLRSGDSCSGRFDRIDDDA